MKIRLSPSGPVVENSNGGPFEPGTGAMLRLAEGYTTIGGSLQMSSVPNTIGTVLGGGTVLIQSLANPNPDLYYRATVFLDVLNTSTNQSAHVVLFIDTSADGSTWTEQAGNMHVVGAGSGIDGGLAGPRQVRLDMTLKLGSTIAELDGANPLRVRARIGLVTAVDGALVSSEASDGSFDDLVGTAYLSLSEHF